MSFSVIESLETRQLLSGDAGALPNLSGQLSIANTVIAVGGQTVKAKLKITNSGGDLVRQTVSIGVFTSPDQTIADAEALPSIPVVLTIKAGKTKTISGKLQLPSDTPPGLFFLMANINNDGALTEAPGANGVASAPLFNPVGEYSGTYTPTGGSAQNLNLSVTSSGGKIYTNVNGEVLSGQLATGNIQSKISGNHYSLHGHGADMQDNISKYNLSMNGLFASTMDEISGKVNATATVGDQKIKLNGTFSVSPIST